MTQTCDLVKRGDVEGLERELGGGEVEEGGKKLDLTCRSCDGRTPLELAAVLGRHDVVKLLLKAGAPPNQTSSSGGFLTIAVITVCTLRKNTTSSCPQNQLHAPSISL